MAVCRFLHVLGVLSIAGLARKPNMQAWLDKKA